MVTVAGGNLQRGRRRHSSARFIIASHIITESGSLDSNVSCLTKSDRRYLCTAKSTYPVRVIRYIIILMIFPTRGLRECTVKHTKQSADFSVFEDASIGAPSHAPREPFLRMVMHRDAMMTMLASLPTSSLFFQRIIFVVLGPAIPVLACVQRDADPSARGDLHG
jgi:hypothetical protein